jgi:tetrapyrrole methylase family protein/MazG family protein
VTGTILVVGLGPAGPELVTEQTRLALEATDRLWLRTTRHPAAAVRTGARSFDAVYEEEATFDAVYRRIVETLVDEAGRGDLVYAVPGSPRVLERTVELLATDGRVAVEVLPAMSFLDLVWARLGIDPLESGIRMVDGHRFAVEAAGERGPLLVAHCHNQRVLSDIKLAVDEPRETEVVILQRLGLPDEAIVTVPWSELDRSVQADHLTSVVIPQMGAPVAGELVRFAELVATLRQECPWDRQQTHQSLMPHLLEESYEVLEAIEALDGEADGFAHLEEELGDLLFQVVFHATLAAEEGWFTLADVARGVHDKLRARHPHVFADVEVADADEVRTNWEAIKRAEKGRESVMDGIPSRLPAAAYAAKILKRAASVPDSAPPPGSGQAAAAWQRVGELAATDPREEAVAEVLLATVEAARLSGVDAETALRRAAAKRAADVRSAGH